MEDSYCRYEVDLDNNTMQIGKSMETKGENAVM